MCFSARYLPAVLLTLLSLAASLCAQSTTKQASKVPRGSVSGRVTIKEKGAPGVVIGLRKGGEIINPGEPFLRATTDHDGYYRIGNLAPGSYSVTPSAPAFVMTDTKDTRNKSVLVGEDENVEGINFTLVRGGVITGRVTDADGRPLVEQQVNVYSTDMFERQFPERVIFAVKSVQTDDRGIYRIFGLGPGRYKVAAGRTEDALNPTLSQERAIYKQVFHPDVTDQAKAPVIEVSEGSEANNVDIALGRALQTFSASGLVIDHEKGLPTPNLRLGVQRAVGQRMEYVNSIVISNGRGEFVVEGLIPGKYGIYLQQNQGGDMRAEPVSFDITDQDIGGLTVRLTKGASLTGYVVLESEDKAIFAKLSELQLRAFTMIQSGGGSFTSSAMSPIGPDGSFRLAGLHGGTISLMLAVVMNPLQPKGFSITRVERDGGIVSGSRLQIKDGEQLMGVRVIVSYGSATIRGVVKLEDGPLPEGARVFIRVSKPGETLPNFRPTTVDARGHFLMEGLPAGTYELSAVITIGPAPSPPRNVKREVTLTDGAVTDLTITVDMNAPVRP